MLLYNEWRLFPKCWVTLTLPDSRADKGYSSVAQIKGLGIQRACLRAEIGLGHTLAGHMQGGGAGGEQDGTEG